MDPGLRRGGCGVLEREGWWAGRKILDLLSQPLLCDFGQVTFSLGCSFPHLNNVGREEFIFVLEILLAEILDSVILIWTVLKHKL